MSDMRLTVDTNDNYILETMVHAAITSLERGTRLATLVLCDPVTDKRAAEGTYYPYGTNGNGEPCWIVTSTETGCGEYCATIGDTVSAFVRNI